MLQLIINNETIQLDHITFSDGAKTFKVGNVPCSISNISISVNPKTPVSEVTEEIELLLSCLIEMEVLRYGKYANLYLNLPYLPYGRADRVFEKGNPDSLMLFLDWLRDKHFDAVYIQDPHNPKILKIYNKGINFNITEQHDLAYGIIKNKHIDYVVAPDKGAVEKASKLCNKMEVPLLTANKTRDISTGRITSIEFNSLPKPGSTVYIVDDILDGGGTFIPLAEKLKTLDCKVILYVTHLIAAKGLEIFKHCIDEIYFINNIGTYTTRQDVLEFNQRTTFTKL
jgi:ribose-phosphate pyrophosphokinase